MFRNFENQVAKLFCPTSSNLIFKRRFASRKKSSAMPKGGIPDRWEAYKPMGTPIQGTRFITFKVPLDKKFRVMPGDSFTPTELVERIQEVGRKLGLVIDLTNTKRYYRNQELINLGVRYEKIYTEGHVVPKRSVVEQFTQAVDAFTAENGDNDNLIGVHCTHGVNRTGYLVCRYMIDNLQFSPEDAIAAYGEARGYPIERVNYLAALRGETVDEGQQENDHGSERPRSREPRHHNHTSGDSHTGPRGRRNGSWQQTSRQYHSHSSRWRQSGNGPYSQQPSSSGYRHQYGLMNDQFQHMNDQFQHMNDQFQHMNDHYGPESGQYGQRSDYYGQRNDQYNQFEQRNGHYGQRTYQYGQRNGQYDDQYGQRNPHRQGEFSGSGDNNMTQYQDTPGESSHYRDQRYNEPDRGDGQGGSGSSWRHGQVYNGSSSRHQRGDYGSSGRNDSNGPPPSWFPGRWGPYNN